MCGILGIVSLATLCTTLAQNDAGLATCRFFSGFGGFSLVVAMFWISSMFGRQIIGTASSIVLG